MLVSDFHYDLPPESIAQEPLADRAGARMLHLRREGADRSRQPDDAHSQNDGQHPRQDGSHPWEDRLFRDFPDLLLPGDLLVLNNTRVFPARLFAQRSGERAHPLSAQNPAARDFLRGRVEVLLTRQLSDHPNDWECLVRPGRKIGIGEKLFVADSHSVDAPTANHPPASPALEAEVVARGDFGQRTIRFAPVADFFSRVERVGHVPLPPYIGRDDQAADRDRYQTVYAKARGSVAAPTAGLHFTPEILDRIRARGIEVAEITLHVGLGTFQPVRADTVEQHQLHRESYEISPEAADALNTAKAQGRRIVAVGTTTVRTLEDAAGRTRSNPAQSHSAEGIRFQPGRAEADIFIYPGYRFRVVDALLTNFHLPQSTLLMLVCALGGRERVLRAYRHAVEAGYRFYSYGDCMFVE